MFKDASNEAFLCGHVETSKHPVVPKVELSCLAGVDFWSEVGPHSEQVDLMVEPSQVSKVNPYVVTPYAITPYMQ